jgi:hypothetical protein
MATVRKLLGDNPKVVKGLSHGVLTYILHLAPSWLSGWNTCAGADSGCATACLNTAGRGGIPDGKEILQASGIVGGESISWTVAMNAIQRARIARTHWFFEDRAAFLAQLVKEIESGVKRARKLGMVPAFRLNGTSDIRWELYPVTRKGEEFPNIFEAFREAQFYDYTKLSNRRGIPENYHLTFSLSGSNDARAVEALRSGFSVAVPFWTRKGEPLPETFGGVPVIDGDETDIRFLDPRGVIVGLRAKGRPPKGSPFIRQPGSGFRLSSLPTVSRKACAA